MEPNDCHNKTRNGPAFLNAARQAVEQAVAKSPNQKGYAREKMVAAEERNKSVYVLANCWESLNTSSCELCLKNTSSTILKCLPSLEG